MKWVPDLTGRFPQRPHYDPRELDDECEQMVCSFLRETHGRVEFPIPTDDLTKLIERATSDFDPYADLSAEGEEIEGATDFFADKKPVVRIAKELSLEDRREHRLRTTLTHEFGHVHFHAFLWRVDRPRLIPASDPGPGPRCKRATILDAAPTDWMEWQAGFACGALLMPLNSVRKLVQDAFRKWRLYNWVTEDSDQAQELIGRIAEIFDVSREAARVRLYKLGYLSKLAQGASLFHS